ncbi:PQQ-binding-like beta-propeller repeat protein [Ferrimonas balearica]|uniref:outer membrane protein assembly factor BamB family protein n=1 Tax=Ferrimonas balearica TaxID=44012 RepID=UPI001C991237|nr:PQQ-binding-like beta-propeller repeat protein [Ferrimonas balearica]MBY5921587.1 PQQ-binding-like beta-propeller repeat protein [Ferrimonas balearica]MBY5995073.1 PQQ-binding-like beta-propeller repeat protein [Ferrimonas balearica]
MTKRTITTKQQHRAKALLYPAVLLMLSACGGSDSSEARIDYGPLHGQQASVPGDPAANLIPVNGNTTGLLQQLDASRDPESGGLNPALYLLPTRSPASLPEHQWQPQGIPEHLSPATLGGEGAGFYALHGDTRNSDEVIAVAAPTPQLNWIAETHLLSYEGGVFDRQSNVYVVPVDPVESVYLYSLDGQSGERRWSLPGTRIGQGGAPLILPRTLGADDDVIYVGSYEYLTAISQSGEVLWDVATGLTAPEGAGHIDTHNFGVNYHSELDAVVALMADGHLVVHDRQTGAPMAEPFSLPGAPTLPMAYQTDYSQLEPFVHGGLSRLFSDTATFFDVLTMVLGGGYEVANYFSIDPNTGRMLIGATAPDEADGVTDGYSAYGALFAVTLDATGQARIEWRRDFEGGTAATPTLSLDGSRVYTADATDQLLAIDANSGELLWSQPTGSGQVVGSVAVSREGGEIFASTAIDIIKFVEMGDCAGNGTTCGEPVWVANLSDTFDTSLLQQATPQAQVYQQVFKPAFEAFYHAIGASDFTFTPYTGNMVLAGITGNGVVAQVGFGYLNTQGRVMPLQISQVLLDRETGEIRAATPGVEESVSVMATAPNGNLYMSNSALRRVLNLGILRAVGHQTNNPMLKVVGSETIGGIAQFAQPDGRHWQLANEIVAVATGRMDNLIDSTASHSSEAVSMEIARFKVLLKQYQDTLTLAHQAGEVSDSEVEERVSLLDTLMALEEGNLQANRPLLDGLSLQQ